MIKLDKLILYLFVGLFPPFFYFSIQFFSSFLVFKNKENYLLS